MEPLGCWMSCVGRGLVKGAVVEYRPLDERPLTGFRVASRLDSTIGLVDDGAWEGNAVGAPIGLPTFGDDSWSLKGPNLVSARKNVFSASSGSSIFQRLLTK